ncbi:prolyl 4-hydroxylase subunit alpha-1-like [Clytia hemisphaerica]
MKCWYKTNDPTLILKPQKFERIWADPEIFMLRDVITNRQIEQLKEEAYPILKRATIQDPITGQLRHADYRVSKSAWLSPSRHEFVRQIALRAQSATNLDIRSSEQLQIANYGIGGHYEPHFDHAREDEDKFTDLGMGNRIATVLYYLSDVEAGGATVFTVGKTAVFPSKGDAVFWYNLKRNGIGNPRTRHAACPVLVGTKWVSNFWIHEYNQEFRRPCALKSHL